MDNAKLDALLKSFAALLAPYMREQVEAMVREEVIKRIEEQVNDLGQIDKQMIADVVRSEISDMNVITSNDLDDALSGLPSEERVIELAADAAEGAIEGAVESAVDSRLESVLEDAVMEILRYKITFTVEAN